LVELLSGQVTGITDMSTLLVGIDLIASWSPSLEMP